jgi:peptidoglycan/LPS O-acetylase OafA/YrhL
MFRSDIEGLRGVAVLLIGAFHVATPGFRGGFVGVDVFFILSGERVTDQKYTADILQHFAEAREVRE